MHQKKSQSASDMEKREGLSPSLAEKTMRNCQLQSTVPVAITSPYTKNQTDANRLDFMTDGHFCTLPQMISPQCQKAKRLSSLWLQDPA